MKIINDKSTDELKNVETIDNLIREKVQAVETDIPAALERETLLELEDIEPEAPFRTKKRLLYAGALATAASILLVIFLFVHSFKWEKPAAVNGEEDLVYIDSARVEGAPANTFIINPDDADITIVWIEKAQENH